MTRGAIRYGLICLFASVVLLAIGGTVRGQGHLALTPVRGASKIKLVYGTRSAVIDLDEELSGPNGTMPGDPPHRYKVLFTAGRGGFVYLVANVQSHSPISDKNAPCGGDSPQAVLWIKADRTLKQREVQAEIYASCSYNYYDSKVRATKTGLTIDFGGRDKKRLRYDNLRPEDGLKVEDVK